MVPEDLAVPEGLAVVLEDSAVEVADLVVEVADSVVEAEAEVDFDDDNNTIRKGVRDDLCGCRGVSPIFNQYRV